MATRFYLPFSTASTPITPTPDAAWDETSSMGRTNTSPTPSNNAFSTINYIDSLGVGDFDCLFRQYISEPFTPSQTITGSQAIKAQIRVREPVASNQMFLAIGIRVLNGTTVQKTVLPVTRDDVEASTSIQLPNRQFTATSASGDYTTVSGDRLVIEVGMGGNSGVHDSAMRLGDVSSATDLPEDDTDITDKRPWVELTGTFTLTASDSHRHQRRFVRRLTEHRELDTY